MLACDECKTKILGTAVSIQFSYPSIMDGERFDFCSDKCGVKWLAHNWVKKVKENMEGAK